MQYLLQVLPVLLIVILVVTTTTTTITAFPGGAPVCNVGAANVAGQHILSDDVKTGSVEQGSYQVILDGTPLLTSKDPAFANLFQFGAELKLTLQSGPGQYLKGLLVIASGGDSNNVSGFDTRTPRALIITDTNRTREPIGCVNQTVSAVGHNSRSQKRSVSMTLQWPTSGQLFYLDVNIVRNNNLTAGSQYYFTQYTMISGTKGSVSPTKKPCGLLRLGFFCPFTLCGFFGKLLGLCNQ
jgi:hypothetical protein